MKLKDGYIKTDYPLPGEYYRIEDTEWGIWPDWDDPGMLVAKAGATPVSFEEAHEKD